MRFENVCAKSEAYPPRTNRGLKTTFSTTSRLSGKLNDPYLPNETGYT